jgi:hypothetical protein
MPGKYENYESRLNSFNNRYKVNFSFESYDAQSLKDENRVAPLKGVKGISRENLKYRNAFLNIYKECVGNMVDKKLNTFKPEELAQEFEKVMDDYRRYCSENGETAPEVNGGWMGTEHMDAMRDTVNSIRSPRVSRESERYLSGELRVRDVRAYVRGLAGEDGSHIRHLSPDELANVMVYREAIKNAVESRPFWWKIIHPFKNHAEQKAVDILNELVSINTQNEVAAQSLVDGEAIDNAKNALESANNHLEEELRDRAQRGERMNLDFLSENANIREVSGRVNDHNVPQRSNNLQV